MEVCFNISNKATYNRKYPPLSVGQTVRTYVKPKSFKQGYESVWSKDIYTITFIKYGTYLLNDYQKKGCIVGTNCLKFIVQKVNTCEFRFNETNI